MGLTSADIGGSDNYLDSLTPSPCWKSCKNKGRFVARNSIDPCTVSARSALARASHPSYAALVSVAIYRHSQVSLPLSYEPFPTQMVVLNVFGHFARRYSHLNRALFASWGLSASQ